MCCPLFCTVQCYSDTPKLNIGVQYGQLVLGNTVINVGFEALHGEVSMYIWFAVTPCVYLLVSSRLHVCSFENLSCFIFYYRGVDFLELGRLLSPEKNCPAF